MARWKALPGGLDPAVVHFVVQLRRIKDHSGLTLPQLAKLTGYSATSWERYLGGRLLPPREAVAALAEVAKADPVRLLARHDLATDAWRRAQSSRAQQEDGVVAEDQTVADPQELEEEDSAPGLDPPLIADHRSRRFRESAIAGVSAIAGAGITLLTTLMLHSGGAHATDRKPVTIAPPVSYTCQYVQKNGQWYTGNSTTQTDHLEVDMYGPEVAELQCLLQRARISPGGIDGSFGPLTESAVIKAQKAFHLDVDGQVGPMTWAALRG